MKKLYGLGAIIMFYLGITFILMGNGSTAIATTGLESVFADITFDVQDSGKWYNALNSKARVQVSVNATPAPVAIYFISTDSH